MQVGTRFVVGSTPMVVREVSRGRMSFSPESDAADAPPRYAVSGADMAAIVRAHVKRMRKSAQQVRA